MITTGVFSAAEVPGITVLRARLGTTKSASCVSSSTSSLPSYVSHFPPKAWVGVCSSHAHAAASTRVQRMGRRKAIVSTCQTWQPTMCRCQEAWEAGPSRTKTSKKVAVPAQPPAPRPHLREVDVPFFEFGIWLDCQYVGRAPHQQSQHKTVENTCFSCLQPGMTSASLCCRTHPPFAPQGSPVGSD